MSLFQLSEINSIYIYIYIYIYTYKFTALQLLGTLVKEDNDFLFNNFMHSYYIQDFVDWYIFPLKQFFTFQGFLSLSSLNFGIILGVTFLLA